MGFAAQEQRAGGRFLCFGLLAGGPGPVTALERRVGNSAPSSGAGAVQWALKEGGGCVTSILLLFTSAWINLSNPGQAMLQGLPQARDISVPLLAPW